MTVESLSGRTVVVTGGAGFIGSHVVEQVLEAEPASLVVVDDLSTGSVENLAAVRDRVQLVQDDITAPAALEAAAAADTVLHLAVRNVRASLRQPLENLRVNADATLALLDAMHGGRRGAFVYISSSEIYGIPADGTYREDTVPAPTTVYGAGKLAGEHLTLAYHRTYGMDTRVVRPFNNFGPRSHFEGDSGEVIPKFILRSMAGRPLRVHGDGSQTRDFMYVEDTARWIVHLVSEPALVGDTVNIGAGCEQSVLDLARRIVDLTGSSSTIEHTEPRPGDLPRLVANTEKVRRLVDYAPIIDFDEGLRRTVAHFASQDVEHLLEREVDRTWL